MVRSYYIVYIHENINYIILNNLYTWMLDILVRNEKMVYSHLQSFENVYL